MSLSRLGTVRAVGFSRPRLRLTFLLVVVLGVFGVRVAAAADIAEMAPTSMAGAPAAGAPPSLSLSGSTLRIEVDGRASVLDLGCEARGYARFATKLYVACGPNGVVRVDVGEPRAPVIDGRIRGSADTVAVVVTDERQSLVIGREPPRPLESIDWTAGTATTTPSFPSPVGPWPSDPAPEEELVASSYLRTRDLWELALGARFFPNIDDAGAGILGDLRLSHRFEAPVAVHLESGSIGIATSDRGTIGTFAGAALLALDTRYFELGAGPGAVTLHDYGFRTTLSVAEMVRIGARDGTALIVKTNIAKIRKAFFPKYTLSVASLELTLQTPAGARGRVFLRGGGGPVGAAYLDLGFRYRLRGLEGRDTFAIVGAVGAAGVFGVVDCKIYPQDSTPLCGRPSYGGPSLDLGAEWRF